MTWSLAIKSNSCVWSFVSAQPLPPLPEGNLIQIVAVNDALAARVFARLFEDSAGFQFIFNAVGTDSDALGPALANGFSTSSGSSTQFMSSIKTRKKSSLH